MRFIVGALLAALVSPASAQFNGCRPGACPNLPGIGPNIPALSVSATNLVAAYSLVKPAAWGGNCITVRRASDNATLDIPYRNNVCDKAAADTFAAGSALTVTKWYDVSGTGNDLVQATGANQPAFTALNDWIMGLRPVSFDGLQASTAKFMTSAPAIDRLGHTIYQVVAPRTGYGVTSYYDLTDAGFTTTYMKVSGSAQVASLIAEGQFVIPTVPMLGGVGLLSVSSAAAGPTQIMRLNGLEISRTRTLTAQAIGLLNIGRLTTGTGNNAINDLFAFLVYSTAHNSAAMQAVEAGLTASFQPQTSFDKLLVYGGTSLFLGQGATLNQQPAWQAGFGRGALGDVGGWKTYLMAVGGQTLVTEAGNVAVYTGLFDGTKSKKVVVIGDITNDLSAPTYGTQAAAQAAADTFYTGTTLPFVASLKAAGFSVVVPTMIARGAYTTVNFKEDARVRYNLNVRNGAAVNGYTVSDRGSDILFNSVAATANAACYQADATHLTNACYLTAVTYDKAAILAQ